MPHHTEFYPMPMFPTLSVGDIDLSTSWYADKVGFSLVFTMPGPRGTVALTHLRWRKYADLLLVPETDSPSPSSRAKGTGMTLSFLAETETIDDMATRLEERDVEIEEGPVNRPWNTRDIVIRDPDGYRLTFFEPIDISLSMEEIIERTSGQR